MKPISCQARKNRFVTENTEHKVNLLVLWRTFLDHERKKLPWRENRINSYHSHTPGAKWQQGKVNQVNAKTLNRSFCSLCAPLYLRFFFFYAFLPLFNQPFVCSFFLLFVCLLPDAEVGQGGVEEHCACLRFFSFCECAASSLKKKRECRRCVYKKELQSDLKPSAT